ncbi:hypothetical protein OIU79_027549 [Salix purpurea]|uniref:Uncharacterized protein n=1 Tax=Salix purpurea TaxID=77065 RepID=A0A9Q0VV66_SALPP|nr:hypothetical protein OIU79_027549 [Salix purpurea]
MKRDDIEYSCMSRIIFSFFHLLHSISRYFTYRISTVILLSPYLLQFLITSD